MNFKYHKDKDIKTNEEEKLPDIILINQDMMDSMVFCSLNILKFYSVLGRRNNMYVR